MGETHRFVRAQRIRNAAAALLRARGVPLVALLAAALPCVPARASTLAARARGAAVCTGASLTPSSSDLAAVDAATLCLVNRERVAYHLRPLHANAPLAGVAASQVSAMVRGDYFADVRPSGVTPMALVARTRYPVRARRIAVGQNLAWGTGRLVTPAHIVEAWMASPPHRAVILNAAFRDGGAAAIAAVPAVVASTPGVTYAFEFGLRQR